MPDTQLGRLRARPISRLCTPSLIKTLTLVALTTMMTMTIGGTYDDSDYLWRQKNAWKTVNDFFLLRKTNYYVTWPYRLSTHCFYTAIFSKLYLFIIFRSVTATVVPSDVAIPINTKHCRNDLSTREIINKVSAMKSTGERQSRATREHRAPVVFCFPP